MHDAVMQFLERMKARRPDAFSGRVRVLECGAYDINGSPRELFDASEYVGLDWRTGPGVDVVGLVHNVKFDHPFDTVVSTEMLEHDPYWQASLSAMIGALRPGGTLLLTWASDARPAHDVEIAPMPQYYRGLSLADVRREVERFDWDEVIGAEERSGLDGQLMAAGKAGKRSTVLSVVIGAVGNVDLTRACIESVREYSILQPQIVLIDNGSTPAESVELARLGADVVIYSPVMLGYPKAMNAGVRAATGAYVCLLNNDAQITQRGWDARLITMLDLVRGAEIIGSYTDFVFNPGQRAPGPGAQDELLETNRLAFVCAVMRRDLFERVGFFDEAYGLGNWEDTDMCMRVQQAGGRILIDPGVFVKHVGHQTMCKLPQFGELLDGNRRLFMEKWKDELQ